MGSYNAITTACYMGIKEIIWRGEAVLGDDVVREVNAIANCLARTTLKYDLDVYSDFETRFTQQIYSSSLTNELTRYNIYLVSKCYELFTWIFPGHCGHRLYCRQGAAGFF